MRRCNTRIVNVCWIVFRSCIYLDNQHESPQGKFEFSQTDPITTTGQLDLRTRPTLQQVYVAVYSATETCNIAERAVDMLPAGEAGFWRQHKSMTACLRSVAT
jgi:hypothetical protein